MTAQFARTPYRGRSGGSTMAEPHAALLIDFDNVTMGIRSDLTKELKNLLNSDIIKGKVAVQRAYADWRRYPQYIVPLAESSVDLIFAPAYGSAKKNATDIRLAIDALELVFTRQEIGTFILLSGDSDFSSLVLKLKEYGKYVIGVGIRESASDLLVQNCDEYYSYSALTGLTRAGEEAPVVSEDPWELVDLGVKQMIANDDVMRSDRLKQVLLEMDPAFDEKALGFQKFNKFLQEAATRGILSLRKQDNGQFEVGPPSDDGEPAEPSSNEARESRRSRGRRGRGRRDEVRTREEPKDQLELEDRAGDAAAQQRSVTGAKPAAVESKQEAPVGSKPASVESTAVGAPPASVESRAVEATTSEPKPTASESKPASVESKPPSVESRPEPQKEPRRRTRKQAAASSADADAASEKAADGADLQSSYDLLRRATADLVRKNGPAARDSDVKRRMLELQTGWDEMIHGFSKFSRFLRKAHDAEVVTLRQSESGNYDVLLGSGDGAVEPPRVGQGGRRDRASGRGRGERKDRESAPEAPRAAQVSEPARTKAEPAAAASRDAGATQATPAAKVASAETPAKGAGRASSPAAPSAAVGFRRGSRGRSMQSGPPPLLEGQTAGVRTAAAPAAAGEPAAARPGRNLDPSSAKQTGGSARKAPAKKTAAATKAQGTGSKMNAAELGLPTDAGEIASYMVSAYTGVGPKSVQSLIETFGASRVFEALESKPDAVRDVMGSARGDRLLQAWSRDVAARRAGSTSAASAPAPAGANADSAKSDHDSGPAKASRARRDGRRSRGGQTAGK